MTTYFAAPDAGGEPTLWMATDDPNFPRPILSRSKLDQPHHWDEIVRRVTDGNLTAQQRWALDNLTVLRGGDRGRPQHRSHLPH